MSEEQAVADPTEALSQGDELSFTSALDAAFAELENNDAPAVEEKIPEPDANPEPETQEETKPEDEPLADKEEKSSESGDDSFDPTADLDSDIGDEWTPKAASRFKSLKTELKTSHTELEGLRQQVTEQESKIKELSGVNTDTPEYAELQSKLAKYENEKMFTNLEDTDAYKSAVSTPLDTLMDSAKGIADKYDINAESLIDAFAEVDQEKQDEALSEMLVDASDRDKAKIYRIIEDINPILDKRKNLMENAEGALSEAKLAAEKQDEQQATERLQDRVNAARNVVTRVKKKLPFLSGIDGIDMNAIQEKASEVDPSAIHPVDYTYNSVSAQILPFLLKDYAGLQKEVDVLTDKLSEYEGAEPRMSGTAPTSQQAARNAGKDSSFIDGIEAALSGAGL
jgi:hypothetical protein